MRILSILLLVFTIGLTGCIDIEQKYEVNEKGAGTVTVNWTWDKSFWDSAAGPTDEDPMLPFSYDAIKKNSVGIKEFLPLQTTKKNGKITYFFTATFDDINTIKFPIPGTWQNAQSPIIEANKVNKDYAKTVMHTTFKFEKVKDGFHLDVDKPMITFIRGAEHFVLIDKKQGVFFRDAGLPVFSNEYWKNVNLKEIYVLKTATGDCTKEFKVNGGDIVTGTPGKDEKVFDFAEIKKRLKEKTRSIDFQ